MPAHRPSLEDADTRDLARQARAGCRASFAALVRRYAGPLQDFLRGYAGPGDAEDLVQESFLIAWNKIANYDERWSFSTWLFTIAQRLTVSRWRKQRPELAADHEFDREGREEDPQRVIARREESKNLWDLAREALSPDQYSALWLSYAEGADTAEIAQVLGRARATIRVMLFRARSILRAQLPPETLTLQRPRPGPDNPTTTVLAGGRS